MKPKIQLALDTSDLGFALKTAWELAGPCGHHRSRHAPAAGGRSAVCQTA